MDHSTQLNTPGRYPLASLHPSHPQFATSTNVSTIHEDKCDAGTQPILTTNTTIPPQTTLVRDIAPIMHQPTGLPAAHRIASVFLLLPLELSPTTCDIPTTNRPTNGAIIPPTCSINLPTLSQSGMMRQHSNPLPLHQIVLSHYLQPPHRIACASTHPQLQYPIAYFFYGALVCPQTLACVLRLKKVPRVRRARIAGFEEVNDGRPNGDVEGVLYYILNDNEYVRLSDFMGMDYRTAVVEIDILAPEMRRSRRIMGLTFLYAGDTNILSLEALSGDGGETSNVDEPKQSERGLTREPTTRRKSRNRSVRVLADLEGSYTPAREELRTPSVRPLARPQRSPSDPFNFQGINEVLQRLEHEQRENQIRASKKNQNEINIITKSEGIPLSNVPLGDIFGSRQMSSMINRLRERGHVLAKSGVNKPLPPLPRERSRTLGESTVGKENMTIVEEDERKMKHRLAALMELEGRDGCDAENGFRDCERMLRSFFDE